MLKPILAGTLLFASQAFASWQLSPELSAVSFTSVKQNSIAEVHHFETLSATINDAGKLSLKIELASIESLIPIRNERMKSMLFDIANNPYVQLEADVSKHLSQLKPGIQEVKGVKAMLTLNGHTQPLKMDLFVNKSKQSLQVTPVKSVLIDSKLYKLDTGIEALRKVAGLKSIATSVPVTFNLVFRERT